MNLAEISHHAYMLDCYSLTESDQKISIRTGKDIDRVSVYVGDPFKVGMGTGENIWTGDPFNMKLEKELSYHNIWSVIVSPKYKRLKYHFELWAGSEHKYLLEDGFYDSVDDIDDDWMMQRFIFPWMNPSDVCRTPEWVPDTIWYQIFPERFAKGNTRKKRFVNNDWVTKEDESWHEFYGGDIEGIRQKLPYLKELGISGIYLTPVFYSTSNHKYDTIDYTRIDPDFGTEEEMTQMIEEAHSLGIRIMVDAVMNHSGKKFAPWLDVLENGPKSKYADWFFVNNWPISQHDYKTLNGDFFSFAFEAYMPKLNTNNPDVMEYFKNICTHWVKDWNVDGIRFDVGNEVAHSFIKFLRKELKSINPELFLLGEIWHDSLAWLQGDEYDSVMNYPFVATMNNFWKDNALLAKDFEHSINKGYAMYYEQINRCIFNFLDSHDVDRSIDRCQGNKDIFLQKIAILMTLQGSPCIYYGTEIGLNGSTMKANRKCMPWEEIEAGKFKELSDQVRTLLRIRNTFPETKSEKIVWINESTARVIHYKKQGRNTLHLMINAGKEPINCISNGNILFMNNVSDGQLLVNGTIIWTE